MPKLLSVDTHLLKKTALVYRAINHKLRLEILQLLHRKERMMVTEIYTELMLEQSVASQHLAVLRRAGLVRTEREGRQVYYAVDYEQVRMLHEAAEMVSENALAVHAA